MTLMIFPRKTKCFPDRIVVVRELFVVTKLKMTNSSNLKFNKNLPEKFGEFELSDAYLYKIGKNEHNLKPVDNAIKLHLIRNGDIVALGNGTNNDVETMDDDVGNETRTDVGLLRKFKEMKGIFKQIQPKNLHSAIRQTSNFFALHRLQDLRYYHSNEIINAYDHAVKWSPKLLNGDEHLSNVSKLMMSVLFYCQDTVSRYFAMYQLDNTSCSNVAILSS